MIYKQIKHEAAPADRSERSELIKNQSDLMCKIVYISVENVQIL